MDDRSPVTDEGRMWAALSYGSFAFGFPLGVIPLVQRNDAFALRHAKTATAVWLVVLVGTTALTIAITLVSVVTCGVGSILYPVVLLPVAWALLVGIHGLVLSLNGQWDEPLGGFGLGEAMFGAIQIPPASPPQLPPTSSPPPAP